MTRKHLEQLLRNFAPEPDPWFTLDEITRQFAGEFPTGQPDGWLEELVTAKLVDTRVENGRQEWAWHC